MFSKPKEIIKEVPKLVEDTAAKEEAARQKQRADELEKKAKDEEQKRLAAESEAGRAAGPPAAASVPKATNTPPAALGGPSAPPANPLDTGSVGKQHEVTLSGGVKVSLCFCPAGSFAMGSPSNEEGHSDDEEQVKVTLTQPFWLARMEFTQAQWRAVMGTDPSFFKGDELPVEQVSWEDAQACIAKLNEKARLKGWKWALPTEAQWEYACRAGTTTPFHFGSVLDGQEANCNGTNPYGTTMKGPYLKTTVKVGSYAANPWGLCDMHGNVWEWCADAWDGASRLPGGSDPISTTGLYRVYRGGSWSWSAKSCRAAIRSREHVNYTADGFIDPHRLKDLGIRPALVPSSP